LVAAQSRLDGLTQEVKSREGKAALAIEQERMNRMQDLHRFLIAQLNARPPRQRIDAFGGRVARADEEGVTVASIDGGATTPWDRISDRLYFRLIDFYLKSGNLAEPERADMLLSAATMLHATAPIRSAAVAPLQAAVSLDGSLVDTARRLMPELPVPETESEQR
jgi:hypothetical protein